MATFLLKGWVEPNNQIVVIIATVWEGLSKDPYQRMQQRGLGEKKKSERKESDDLGHRYSSAKLPKLRRLSHSSRVMWLNKITF